MNALPPDRSFGILVGDTLTRRVLVTVTQATAMDDRTLPAIGPVAPSLDLRDVVVSQTSRGENRTFVIDLTYQSFVAPDQVARADAPGFIVAFADAGRRFNATVPGFTYLVSPFRHDLQPVIDPNALRPDHAPALPDLALSKRWFVGSVAVALACVGLLAVDRYLLFAGGGMAPFARAARGIAGRKGRLDAASVEDDVRTLHRAFDATAEGRVLANDLDSFFVQHPRFAALRAEIEIFYAASHAIFFTGKIAPNLDLRQFARALARAERRR